MTSPGKTRDDAPAAPARYTPRYTQTADRLDVLARAVLLVAGMQGLTDDERHAVLDRLVGIDKPK